MLKQKVGLIRFNLIGSKPNRTALLGSCLHELCETDGVELFGECLAGLPQRGQDDCSYQDRIVKLIVACLKKTAGSQDICNGDIAGLACQLETTPGPVWARDDSPVRQSPQGWL
jgi:hypothetical protein